MSKEANEKRLHGHNDTQMNNHSSDNQISQTSKRGELLEEQQRMTALILVSAFYNRDRHTKIRLQKWIEHILQGETASSQKQNRLNHLKLLKLMCDREHLAQPFTAFPARSHLSILQKHQIKRISDQVENKSKITKQKMKKQELVENFLNLMKNTQEQIENDGQKHILTDSAGNQSRYSEQIELKKTIRDKISTRLSKKCERTVVSQETEDIREYKFKQMKPIALEKYFLPKPIQTKLHRINQRAQSYSPYSHSSNFDDIFEQNMSPTDLKTRRNGNSLSDSINLEIYPHSVSNQIRKYTNRISKVMVKSDKVKEKQAQRKLDGSMLAGQPQLQDNDHSMSQFDPSNPRNRSNTAKRGYPIVRKPISLISRHISLSQRKQAYDVDVKEFQTRNLESTACCDCFNFEKREDL